MYTPISRPVYSNLKDKTLEGIDTVPPAVSVVASYEGIVLLYDDNKPLVPTIASTSALHKSLYELLNLKKSREDA